MAPTGTGASPINVAGDRVISTVDPETRHAHKTVHRRQDGFKAHIAVEPDTGIITDCALTKASGSDNHEAVIGLALLDNEDSPVRVLGDSAYGTGAARAALASGGHVAVIKPLPLRTAVPGGFTSDDFTIDFDARTVTCPASHTLPNYFSPREQTSPSTLHEQSLASSAPSHAIPPGEYRNTDPFVIVLPYTERCVTAAPPRTITGSTTESPS